MTNKTVRVNEKKFYLKSLRTIRYGAVDLYIPMQILRSLKTTVLTIETPLSFEVYYNGL